MRKQTKLVAVLSTAALLAIGASMTSFAAQGWAEEDGTWVYYDRNGERVTDKWAKSGNNWYYLDSDGEMAIDTLIEDGDNYYYVDINGVMASNQWVAIENEDAGEDNEPEHYWYYFQANGKALKNGDNAKVALKTVNGKKYAFDHNGAMTAEWSLDKEDVAKLATPDQAHSDNSGTGSNAVSAKYAQQWRYFNSVEDGSRVSKGWFKVVAAEWLNNDKFDDDDSAWYYADGSGNLYAGEFKTIKGKKYAFRDDGRMVDGLKFIRPSDNNGLDIVADDDGTYNFDNEDDFNEHALDLEALGYRCYYFGSGDDGAMKTNKTSVEIDGDKYNFYFEKSGSLKGAGVTGKKDDKYYQSGKLMRAGADEKYQVVIGLETTVTENGKDKTGHGYYKLSDALEFLGVLDSREAVSAGVNDANIAALKKLGVNKDAKDLSELYIMEYNDKAPADAFFLVNTSGKVIDSKSKNKDGNDYYYVVNKGGKIAAVYVED